MALALAMRKEDHTPGDLMSLAKAPYFDTRLIRQKPDEENEGRKRRRGRGRGPAANSQTDEGLLPPGALIHSHGIAPSTRQALEKAVGFRFPTVGDDNSSSLLSPQELQALLDRHQQLSADESLGHLYQLLKTAAELGFAVGWYEALEESQPRGWR